MYVVLEVAEDDSTATTFRCCFVVSSSLEGVGDVEVHLRSGKDIGRPVRELRVH